MKQILALALVALLFTGCASTGGDRQVTVQDFTPAIKTAAFGGTYYALQENPHWRAGFELAAADLAILENAEAIDFATIMAIIARLPVKELNSSEAKLAITGATMLLSGYGDRIVSLDKLENVRPIAAALRQGIELGLQ